MTRIFVTTAMSLSLLTIAFGYAGAEPPSPQARHAPVHFVVVVDRSTSITTAETDGYAHLVNQLIEELSFGDRVTMFVAFEDGRRHGTKKVSRQMPIARNPDNPLATERAALDSARASLNSAAKSLFKEPALQWTDLLTSFRDAGEQYDLHDQRGRVLVVLSDMLHCVPNAGGLCMDRKDFKHVRDDWFDGERSKGTIASLEDVCVLVIGAEQANTRDANVRDFWTTYFKTAGGEFAKQRYRYAPQGALWRECQSLQQTPSR